MERMQKTGMFCSFVLAAQLGIVAPSWGTDCNNDGIEDSVELAQCPAIDLVTVIDTSFSAAPDISDLCSEIDDAIAELRQQGLMINDERLAIWPGGVPCPCCTSNVSEVYGQESPVLPERLGGCAEADSSQPLDLSQA